MTSLTKPENSDKDSFGTEALPPPVSGLAPVGHEPPLVERWFSATITSHLRPFDGTLFTARQNAEAFARRAKALNTRRAYLSSVRAWCNWCDLHGLPCLPGRPADVAAFLAGETSRGMTVNTVHLRRSAIRYLHFAAGCAVPTAEAQVVETLSGIRREAAEGGNTPKKKVAATLNLLKQILAPIGDDLPGLRDRALLLVGFTCALRRAELAGILVEHLEDREGGLRIRLPSTKGDRLGKGVTVALPHGVTQHCPVRALRLWLQAAGIARGPVFRRVWRAPRRSTCEGKPPIFVVGTSSIEPRTVARIVQSRAAGANLDGKKMGGHSLKRGALTTGMEQGIHPTRLKQLGRHKSYNVLDEYLEFGEPFMNHPLNGML